MQIALNARNKFVIVNGTFEKPSADSPLLAQWERVNDLVITWILNSVIDEISDGLNYVTTAREVWLELTERFSGINGHRIYQVLKDIHSLDQGTKSVEVYFHKLKALWDEYVVLEPNVNCTCGAHKVQVERDHNRKLLQFLMGLHDSNATVRGQILLMNPLPTVSQAYAFVKQDEKARQGYQNNVTMLNPFANLAVTGADTLNVTTDSGNRRFTANRGNSQSGNTVGSSAKSGIKCSYCNFNGHTRENCYKLIGYPANWKKKEKPGMTSSHNSGQFRNLPKANLANVATPSAAQQNAQPTQSDSQITQMQQQINQLSHIVNNFVGLGKKVSSSDEHITGMAVAYTNFVQTSDNAHIWLIDTGATDHMCCSFQLLRNVVHLSTPAHVVLPNRSHVLVKHVGSFSFNDKLTLHNVLFVPTFHYNLLSVPKWTSDTHGTVTFFPDHCIFQVQNQKDTLALGKVKSGLYHLDLLSSSPAVSSNSSSLSSINSASKQQLNALWHMRLGHVSTPVLCKISAISSDISAECNKLCPICPLSKQTKLPFSLSSSHATNLFDLIHVDLWGPYAYETTSGCKFFLTIVNDHSRALWTFLLPTKQHVYQHLTHFCTYVQNQFHTTVKNLEVITGQNFLIMISNPFYLKRGSYNKLLVSIHLLRMAE